MLDIGQCKNKIFNVHAESCRKTRKFNVNNDCAVTIYSLCYSVMKSWTVVIGIETHAIYCYSVWKKILYENVSSLNKYLSSDDLPKTVDLCRTDVI